MKDILISIFLIWFLLSNTYVFHRAHFSPFKKLAWKRGKFYFGASLQMVFTGPVFEYGTIRFWWWEKTTKTEKL